MFEDDETRGWMNSFENSPSYHAIVFKAILIFYHEHKFSQ